MIITNRTNMKFERTVGSFAIKYHGGWKGNLVLFSHLVLLLK